MADVDDGTVHDVIDLASDATGPAEPDIVTLDEAGGDPAATLPASAALQPNGTVILTLHFPVTLKYRKGQSGTVREETYETLTMHRLNGAAMRAIMSAGEGHVVPTGIAQSCRMAQSLFNSLYDRLDGADATAAAMVFNYFLSAGRPPSGQPPSP